MSKRWQTVILVLLALTLIGSGGAFAFWWYTSSRLEAEQAEQANARYGAAQDRRALALIARLQHESSRLMPEMLRGVALGMEKSDVAHVRPQIKRAVTGGEPGKVFFEETLSNGAGVMYGFESSTMRLSQVQIMSLLDTPAAIAPHLRAMNDMYGRPTGAYDCKDTGGVPTRRFTWRKETTGIADIFLIYGDRISVTLYIGPNEMIAASLQRSECAPVAPEGMGNFPQATTEQLQGAHP